MKIVKVPLLLISFAALLYGCQKDFNDPSKRESDGRLKDSIGNCTPFVIAGHYETEVDLTGDNWVDIHVQVDSVGKYFISTDTVNGYSFTGVGTLGYKGDNRVRLYGHGKPLSGGTDVFTVKYKGDACRFEVNVSGVVIPPATYTLDTASGNCSGAIVDGSYLTNIATTADANKVTLKVNVKTAGKYNITTGSVNGITFAGSGVFTAIGSQNVVLKASGTPQAEGSFNYTLSSGTTCIFTVTTAKGPDAAVFTLGGASGNCTGFAANGTYTAGTALGTGNTVTCQVNVTVPGVYSISTNTVNGITFSSSGTFTSAGTQTVTLTGSGTPTASGNNNFTVTAATGSCTFSITTVSGGTNPPPATGSNLYFQFNDGSKLIASDTSNVVALMVPNMGMTMLSIEAFSKSGDTSFALSVALAGTPQTGVSYKTNVLGTPLSIFTVMTTGGQLYQADFSTSGVVISIVFDKIDLTNKIVSGTFSGTAQTPSGSKTLTNGKFKALMP